MLHRLIDEGWTLDEVCYYDTGMEFPAIYEERDRTLPLLRERGIEYTELRPKQPMWWDMFCRPVRQPRERRGAQARLWLVRRSVQMGHDGEDGGARQARQGAQRGRVRGNSGRRDRANQPRPPGMEAPPLVEMACQEADCLELCYRRGHDWEQDGVRLIRRARPRKLLVLPETKICEN